MDNIITARPKRNIDEITTSSNSVRSDKPPVVKMPEGPRHPPLTSQSETAALAPASAFPEPSRSLPNVAVEEPLCIDRESLSRRSSRPFKLNEEEPAKKKEAGTKGKEEDKQQDGKKGGAGRKEGVASWTLTKGQQIVHDTLNCVWECGTALVHDVASLVEPVRSYFHPKEKPEATTGGRLRLRSGDEELMALMENQTQTLLEINKFLREELVTIKEERDIAEQMVSRIERKCREALQQKMDSIEIHVLFDLLFGAGAAEVTFGKQDDKPGLPARKTFGPQKPERPSTPAASADLSSPDYGLRVLDSQNRLQK
ncbi:hypothetical protein RvY_12896 [Ramazzottius varieornatus]|uniref:Uncharacterized protein n=1 Tax=Ramazzottius varieornatus TaxID=947166 RepID=A0A1D1VN12_RAMVA|nr:hypothetical protein RvY_12896 [Ramazzottius varieornatus]